MRTEPTLCGETPSHAVTALCCLWYLYVLALLFSLYLIDSPVVRAETLCFKRAGVQAVVKDVFLPWLNAYRFFEQNAELFASVSNTNFYEFLCLFAPTFGNSAHRSCSEFVFACT